MLIKTFLLSPLGWYHPLEASSSSFFLVFSFFLYFCFIINLFFVHFLYVFPFFHFLVRGMTRGSEVLPSWARAIHQGRPRTLREERVHKAPGTRESSKQSSKMTTTKRAARAAKTRPHDKASPTDSRERRPWTRRRTCSPQNSTGTGELRRLHQTRVERCPLTTRHTAKRSGGRCQSRTFGRDLSSRHDTALAGWPPGSQRKSSR